MKRRQPGRRTAPHGGFLTATVLLLAVCGSRAAAEEPARETLARLREHLPRQRLVVEADLELRDRDRRVERRWTLSMTCRWGDRPPGASIVLGDRFGERVALLSMRGDSDGGCTWTFDPPDADELLAEAGLAPEDLSLSFLWWPRVRSAGADTIKGRPCRILDVEAPPDYDGAYRRVRLWVDREAPLLLQARAYGGGGRLLRTMEVKSFRRVGKDTWTLLRAEWHEPDSGAQAVLHIRKARPVPRREPSSRR